MEITLFTHAIYELLREISFEETMFACFLNRPNHLTHVLLAKDNEPLLEQQIYSYKNTTPSSTEHNLYNKTSHL